MSIIREAPGKKIVAVVGAGHVNGMLSRLEEPVDRAALCVIPPPSTVSRVVKWIIPAIVLGAFYYGYTQHSGEEFRRMLYAWIIPNSVLAAVLTAIAGGKLLTILTALVASPITSLNPTIGAGMVAGLVEAWLRRPTVQDCEHLSQDMASLRGIYGNRVTRVLLVAILATIGSALGAWVGATWVVTLI
jgi:pheromone shutdown protein TraB